MAVVATDVCRWAWSCGSSLPISWSRIGNSSPCACNVAAHRAQQSPAVGGTLLRAMRGDTAGARALLPILDQLVGSEDPQDQAQRQTSIATTAMSAGDYETALTESRKTLALGDAMGIRSDPIRWSWPLAADAALA